MADKHRIWINEFLIPFIVNDERMHLQQSKPSSNVRLKGSEICQGDDNCAIFTICYTINIVLDVDGEETTLAVFAKVTPEMKEEVYNMVSLDEKFLNETIAYKKVLPALNPSVHFPTFRYSHVQKMNAALAISDFSANGFSMCKSLVNLSLDHILASMRAIGNFHGASFAIKYNDPDQFDALRNELIDAGFKIQPTFPVLLRNATKRATNFFRKTATSADVVTEAFLKDFEKLFCEQVLSFLKAKSDATGPLAVICHGDFLRNNIAFQYDDHGLATDAILFDLQNVRYGSPMLDLCAFMAISTGYEVRQKHFDEIFRTYYDAVIDQFLSKTNLNACDVPDFMSYDAFLKEYTLYLPFGFHITCFFLPQMVEPTKKLVENFGAGMTDHVLTQGGEAVDRETRAQIMDIYNFYQKFNLNLLEY